MRIALGQFAASTDKSANLSAMEEMVDTARQKDADFLAFPEYSMFYQATLDESVVSAAESLEGPFVSAVRSLARIGAMSIGFGIVEAIDRDRRAHNAYCVVGPDGNLVAVYRKIHLYDAFDGAESEWIKPGETVQDGIAEVGGLRFGLLTCYDIRFPELARSRVDKGAEALLIPAAWRPGYGKESHWNVLIRARAIENTVYVLAPAQPPPECTGGTAVVDPMGVIVADAGGIDGIVVADISLERVMEVRAINPALQHRRIGDGISFRALEAQR